MSLAVNVNTRISIAWSGGTVIYADKSVAAVGAILSFDVVTEQGKVGSMGQVTSAQVVLDDTDGSLKSKYDTEVIEGTICTVTQHYTGGVTKTVTLLVGQIVADVVWSEGERTLSFGILSTIVDDEVGFAPEEGDYSWVHPDAYGVPWPMCFGKVVRVPAIKAKKPYVLKLLDDITYATVSFDIEGGSSLPQSPTTVTLTISEVIFQGTFSGDTFTPSARNIAKYTNLAFAARVASDDDFTNLRVAWIVDSSKDLRGLYCLVQKDGVWVANQCIAQDGQKVSFAKPWDAGFSMDAGDVISEAVKWPRTAWATAFDVSSDLYFGSTHLLVERDVWSIAKDSDVYYTDGATPVNRYVCNLFPSTSVVEVLGHRTFFGKKILVSIPSSYYTVQLNLNIGGGLNITAIDMDESLESKFCEHWDGDIFVSLESTVVGNGNTVDILEHILTNYTNLAVDGTSFTIVKSNVSSYPSHFALFDIRRALELCQDIAWQAKCGLVIRNQTAYLTYLPTDTSLQTLDSSDLEAKSIILGLTTTEGIVTRLKASWLSNYAIDDDGPDGISPQRTHTFESNIDTYGLHELAKNFFIYNIVENVKAAADFWGYRLANVWKTFSARVVIDVNDIHVFDVITISSTISAKGPIESVEYDTFDPIITISSMLSTKAGTTSNDAGFWSTSAGDSTNPLAGLSQLDYTVTRDDQCPETSSVYPIERDRFRLVFVDQPRRIIRGRRFRLAVEIQDSAGILQTINSAATLFLVSSDRGDVFQEKIITITAGQWDSDGFDPAGLVVPRREGGLKFASYHIWVRINDSRIRASRTGIGAD